MKLTKVLAGLLLALAIVLAVFAWMLSRQQPRSSAVNAVPVTQQSTSTAPVVAQSEMPFRMVVAARPIVAGQMLAMEDLKIEHAEKFSEGAFKEPADLVGKTLMIHSQPGQVILEQQLVAGLSLQLVKGERAVSIAVKESMAAGNHVRPGDFVDVFFTLQDDGRAEKIENQTRLLIARSRVLAYGANTVEDPPATAVQRKAQAGNERNGISSANSAPREDARPRVENANTAVLAVPLEDVQRLTLAEKFGYLSLALRNPEDIEVPDLTHFAALPPALRPNRQSNWTNGDLTAADKAFAGLKFKDLANGSGKSDLIFTKNVDTRVGTNSSKKVISPSMADTVELHNGIHIETVRY